MSNHTIHETACSSLSRIVRENKWSVEETTQFLRGEFSNNSRPNKVLDPMRLQLVLEGYPHLDQVVQIAKVGINVTWRGGPHPRRPPSKNHGSCRRYLRAVTRSLREGQDSGQYMVVDADILKQWPEVVCSPLGAVEKKGVDPAEEVRTIHDLSYPKNDSVNVAFVTDSVPKVRYKSVIVIARRIEWLANAGYTGIIRILKGDVKSAFRHLMTQANQVFRMAALVEDLGVLIIDMAAPFGWSGSPPCYALFGGAISWLMGTNSPATVSESQDTEPFFPYEWVDDHILVEPDVENRLQLAEATLRHAMLAVLGPRSINESKFSEWSSEIVALGLRWNTIRRTLSIPEDKIAKAYARVVAMSKLGTSTKTEFYKLLGSLRHVANFLRTAKPFYLSVHLRHVLAEFNYPRELKKILFGFSKYCIMAALLSYRSACLERMCGDLPTPQVELYIDASNMGLTVLDPACDSFIQQRFVREEMQLIDQLKSNEAGFSLNTREHLCIAVALWTWGAKWHRQSSGQVIHEINRTIGRGEAYFNLRVSADHIPESTNRMADTASRAWTEPHLTRPTFRRNAGNLTSTFRVTSDQIVGQYILKTSHANIPTNSRYSQHIVGAMGGSRTGNSAATVLVKISHISWHHRRVLVSDCYQGIRLPSQECDVQIHQASQNLQSHRKVQILAQILRFYSYPAPSPMGASVLGYFFLLRRSEYLAVGSNVQSYAIRRSDVKFVDRRGRKATMLHNVYTMMVHFRGSKSDQFGMGTSRVLTRSGSQWCCPVLAAWFLASHYDAMDIETNFLLCSVDVSQNLQVRDVVNALK
ncbi:LOW QUALITY PROTEIN: hypothetical protein PHMEG_00019858 [Phytophthora megakarya]|uniref:Reverse transcriptase n=1 Tax=Phytophthora megakarya TaxID=4795 RepID=A0A225VQX6_9STRA|nr:LOW QUALITY PROTEIN: hypothetical protein PHMEG_00019858 [Phytophthora megakarya]